MSTLKWILPVLALGLLTISQADAQRPTAKAKPANAPKSTGRPANNAARSSPAKAAPKRTSAPPKRTATLKRPTTPKNGSSVKPATNKGRTTPSAAKNSKSNLTGGIAPKLSNAVKAKTNPTKSGGLGNSRCGVTPSTKCNKSPSKAHCPLPQKGWKGKCVKLAPKRCVGRPTWTRVQCRTLPGCTGAPNGWCGRFRHGCYFAPNYCSWAYSSYCVKHRCKLFFHQSSACWYYLSPRYGCFVPYKCIVVIEKRVEPDPQPDPDPTPDPENPDE